MAKPHIAPDAVLAALRRRMGPVEALVPITEGMESRAFALRAGGEAFVVRVNAGADGFEKDAFAYRHFASPELPIPEVVAIDALDDGNAYCVSRRLPGRTLQALEHAELPAVLGPVARVMRAIAAADVGATGGFGRLDGRGVGEHADWRSFLASIADPRRFDWTPARRFADGAAIDRLLALAMRLGERCPDQRRLVHGDFGSNNVLTNGRCITGVIDWEDALIGDPLYDVAGILYWRPWLDCMEQQARFFERHCPDMTGQTDRLLCYQLRIGLEEVLDNAAAGDRAMAAWALARCEAVVRAADRR